VKTWAEPGTRQFVRERDPWGMLCRRVEPYQGKLATHPIYTRVRNLRGLQIFMTNHVFAVWDFMTLTKTLQQRLTCVSTPWLPPEHPTAARLVNEIVLGEESDEVTHGEYLSHYVLYMRAMDEIGADPSPVMQFEAALRAGTSPADALAPLSIAQSTKDFVLHTLATAQRTTPEVAASLLLAREDLIPTMFERVVKEMDAGRCATAARPCPRGPASSCRGPCAPRPTGSKPSTRIPEGSSGSTSSATSSSTARSTGPWPSGSSRTCAETTPPSGRPPPTAHATRCARGSRCGTACSRASKSRPTAPTASRWRASVPAAAAGSAPLDLDQFSRSVVSR
jgi:hypothetical protein